MDSTEKRIIELIAQGLTSKEIAPILGVNVHRLRTINNRLIHKVGAKNACELVSYAYKTGILQVETNQMELFAI